ncbi:MULTISPECIES: ParA family protein [unclassified Variovorax]|uniref:ParA family protein n=1 Tax=unclassified Variovorax TaxID=663243 RepID=UPI000837E07A|nr:MULTISPECIES: ParA family protein [unclassified Variovorax]PNG50004.1 Chromosome-partitioning ATPase Soj [Variovorax sp. B2]PNG50876.1 Chromosome-partitioning ATPase Soj [Variovorax sp. B4]VTU41593.1 ParA-like protein [Variovorax sp. PBL-H6]VTU44707.1 ParA-like protein [Variovorax sp. SRS16]VTU44745.1 ParA-like protein [Variovorax sp. PBL-E5]
MKKTRIIVTANQKGGAGKTTVAMCLADALSRKGLYVVTVDADPQATAFKWESRPSSSFPRFPVRVEKRSGFSPLEFLQALNQLNEEQKRATGEDFDFIVIDTPPNLASSDLEAALFVADQVVVPAKPNGMFVDALEELFPLFAEINELRATHGRPRLDVRLLVNFMQAHRRTNVSLVTVLRESVAKWSKLRQVRAKVLATQLKQLSAFENAPNYRTSLYRIPGSRAAREEVDQLLEELL